MSGLVFPARRKGTGCNPFVGLAINITFFLGANSVVCSQQPPPEPSPAAPLPQLTFRPAGRAAWLLSPYRTPVVGPSRTENSDLVSNLLHDGKLSLSLHDAIELAIENNFDVELQRYDHAFATTEIMRAQGGGLLRGVPTTVEELPSGEGGPGEPLLTTVGGYSPVLQLPSSAADLATITGTQSDLSILSPTPPPRVHLSHSSILLCRRTSPSPNLTIHSRTRFQPDRTISPVIPSPVARDTPRDSQRARCSMRP
jgi:hypothetical protein